ncbi:MAG: CoA-binding protein [Desulfobacteraceae bacterium A6]|nr:MAG: CoA-binding protein [Desulfobacteraceae bacterium A6]
MLEALFRPKSVAVIGASAKELSIGNRIIKNLIDFGYTGAIYPINPKADEIRGIKAYPSVFDVPGEIDLAHMVIAGKFVPNAVEDCGKKGIKAIIINSAGFTEIGPEGAALQKDFLERAKKYGIRILGPNCQGIINTDPALKAYCNFTFTKPEPGFISIVAQSGGVGELIHQGFSQMDIGTRIYASNGNASDISITEILEYLGDDEGTRVIALYVESLSDPKAFMDVAKKVSAKKTILAMKAGRTAEGAKASSSHTGGLAKTDIAIELIFEKLDILTFRDEGELCQAAAAFAAQPIPAGNRVGIITNTGGPAVIATDVLVDAGMQIPTLSEKAMLELKGKLFAEAAFSNPVDVLATADAGHFRAAMDVMMAEDQIDSLYINFVTPFFVDTEKVALQIAEVNKQRKKPIVCNLMTDPRQWVGTVDILKSGGVPCYSFPSTAARALAALSRYGALRSRNIGKAKRFSDVDSSRVDGIIKNAAASGRNMLSAGEVYPILDAYHIPCAAWKMSDTVAEAEAAADAIGYPVVIKADAASVIHKSDVGGVAVNLQTREALREAVSNISAKIGASDLKFLVQKYQPGGRELIIGAKAEKGLGHLIMFGLGGIYVEILKDVSFKITPVTEIEAAEMIASLKTAALLQGVRGEAGIDQPGVIDVILRLSQLVTDFPRIQEMDLNPVMAFSDRIIAVDARISI